MSQSSMPAVGAGTPGADTHVSPVYLIPLLDAAVRAGISCEALFHGLGLMADDLDNPGFTLARHEANTIVRRALRLLRAPALGLELGRRTRITERGALALGLMAAQTLGDSLALAREFPASAGDLMSVYTERSGRLHLVIADPMPGTDDIAPFLTDIMFAGSVQIGRQVTGEMYAPAVVELKRERPDNASAYEDHFGCPVLFSSGRNSLATDLAWLKQPLAMANTMAYRQSRQWLDRSLNQITKSSTVVLAVERAILRALPQTPAPAALARSLHLSARSLRRALATHGLSLRGLLDAARRARALELVTGTSQPLADIALQTGFSDVRAFSRAFRRWTGQPPSALRSAANRPASGPHSLRTGE